MAKYVIIFPNNYFDPKAVDPAFQAEKEAAEFCGFATALYSHEWLEEFGSGGSGGKFLHVPEACTDGSYVGILRGWMTTPGRYKTLYVSLIEQCRIELINLPGDYMGCHWFPMAYPYISSITPCAERFFWQDREIAVKDMLERRRWPAGWILKDFVKAVKDPRKPHLLHVPGDVSEARLLEILEEFHSERGKLFTMGICLKQVAPLDKPDGKTPIEWRSFWLNGKLASLDPNSQTAVGTEPPPSDPASVLNIAGKSLSNISNFFTVDLAKQTDGTWTVIEVGDGGVSGPAAHADLVKFYASLKNQ